MKKILFIALFSGLLVPSLVYASLDPLVGPITVDSFGSTTQKTEFELFEIPFTYVAFDRDNINTDQSLVINWIWRNPTNKIVSLGFDSLTNFPNDPVETWDSVSNWENVKEPGEWEVRTSWFNSVSGNQGGFGSQKIHFTVHPEPISSLLFIIGGGPIAFALLRKRKNLE